MKDLENTIREYLEERGWHNLRPANLAKSIMIEGAELLEIFQWDNQTADEVRRDPEKIALIKKELADVMLYCLDMAVTLNLDTKQIILDKLERTKAKYPKELFNKENAPEEPGTEAVYWQVKSNHRKQGE